MSAGPLHHHAKMSVVRRGASATAPPDAVAADAAAAGTSSPAAAAVAAAAAGAGAGSTPCRRLPGNTRYLRTDTARRTECGQLHSRRPQMHTVQKQRGIFFGWPKDVHRRVQCATDFHRREVHGCSTEIARSVFSWFGPPGTASAQNYENALFSPKPPFSPLLGARESTPASRNRRVYSPPGHV